MIHISEAKLQKAVDFVMYWFNCDYKEAIDFLKGLSDIGE